MSKIVEISAPIHLLHSYSFKYPPRVNNKQQPEILIHHMLTLCTHLQVIIYVTLTEHIIIIYCMCMYMYVVMSCACARVHTDS